MPESSDNPEAEQKPAGAPRTFTADPVAPSPRAAKAGAPEPAPGGQISLQDLMALARSLSASGIELEDPDAVRGTISREKRKFFKAEPKSAGAEIVDQPAEEEPGGEQPGMPESDAGMKEASLPSMTVRTRRRSTVSARGPGLIVPAAIVLTLAAMAAAVWLLAKIARPAPEKATVAVASVAPSGMQALSLTARANELADKIADAARNHDPAKALALCVLARSEGLHLPGLAYQEARFASAAGDSPAAAVAISHSLDLGEEISACHILRASLIARNGKPEAVLREYEAAAAAAPFEPKPFFFWGESLRRSGRPQAALVRLEEAVARATDPDMADFYRFKERLTLIEIDRGAELADDLKAKLSAPAPAPDWILTAAAIELHKGDRAAATRFLDRAAALLTPDELENRLRDYYFFGFAREPALAKFYDPILNPTHVPVVAAGSPAPASSPFADLPLPPASAPGAVPPIVQLPPP